MSKLDELAAELRIAKELFNQAYHNATDMAEELDDSSYDCFLDFRLIQLFTTAAHAKAHLETVKHDYANALSSYYHDLAKEILREAWLVERVAIDQPR